MPNHAVLVASITDGYDIDWGLLIAEEIQERALKRSTSIPFLYLIYCLCIAVRVEILHTVDTMIKV